MDTFLDLQSLVEERRKHENARLNVFKQILQQCFNTIKRYNKEKIYEMDYKIPLFIIGAPKYDIGILKNYLTHHLIENGLKVIILADGYTLYISWRETDIDLEKYMQKKKSVETQLLNIDGFPVATEKTHTVSPSTMQFRIAKQKQLQEERQNRFTQQNNRWGRSARVGGGMPHPVQCNSGGY